MQQLIVGLRMHAVFVVYIQLIKVLMVTEGFDALNIPEISKTNLSLEFRKFLS